jgi:hypothetical protein
LIKTFMYRTFKVTGAIARLSLLINFRLQSTCPLCHFDGC